MKASKVVTTDAEIDAAIERAQREHEFRALSVEYVPASDQIAVRLSNEIEVRFPRAKLQGLEHATPGEVAAVELDGNGFALVWPMLDVAHYLPGLIEGVFGTRRYMLEIARKGGSVKSPAKSRSSKANGKKGGRPRKVAGVVPPALLHE